MITFVCGTICSGKTTYARAMADLCEGVFIEVSSIVKQLSQKNTRKDLLKTSHLVDEIIEELQKLVLSQFQTKDIIICGARQVEILEAFENYQPTYIWIECPRVVRRQRFVERRRDGETLSFEQCEILERHLGIDLVRKWILTR